MISESLCECGCGKPAPIASMTNRSKGHVMGHPVRFISGHNRRGTTFSHSDEARRRISEARSLSLRDDVSDDAIHMWLLRHHLKTGICETCGANVGTSPPNGTHFAFLRHPEPYTRDRDDYAELCIPCHRRMDAARRAA